MKTAVIIGIAACTAGADETYSTFGEDWGFSLPWLTIGQTMNVPDEASVLESFEFVGETQYDTIAYAVAVFAWDSEGQHTVGSPLTGAFGVMDIGDDPLRHHDLDALLPPGERIVILLSFADNPWADHGVAATADVWDGGAAIATSGSLEDPWVLKEETSVNDLLFKAEWTVCAVDVYADGMLNIFDFLTFQGLYNNGDEKADFNGDGVTNILDFVAFQSAFLIGCGD